jgi:hypothetical protein
MPDEKTYHAGSIRVVKYWVPWEDLDWASLADLTLGRLLEARLGEGLHYHNPEYSLYAPPGTPTDLFVGQARRAQVLWNKRIARVLGAGVRRRAIKREEPLRRQLAFTGVLTIEGKHFHPKAWPDVAARPPKQG